MIKMDVIHSLCTLPATDGNFTSQLSGATPNQIRLAIERMESEDGHHKSRIASCKRELKRRDTLPGVNWRSTKCGMCKIQRSKPICNGCSQFDKYIPMTNADRIRGMSDEELAVTIMCPYDGNPGECVSEEETPRHNCIECCLEWLQKEVE